MELKQLKYFWEVCRSGSFSKAAENLYITQQGISKAISLLEHELKVELFIRTRSGITLTPQGEYLKERCGYLLEYVDETRRSIPQIAVYPRENMKVSLTAGGRIIMPMSMSEEFERVNPGTKISVVERNEYECENDVLENQFDGAIITEPQDEGRFRVYPLIRLPLCVMMNKSHVLAQNTELGRTDFDNLDLIFIHELSRSNENLLQYLKEEKINVTINYRVPSLLSAMELCRENRGCVILAEKIKSTLSHPDIVFVPINLAGLYWNLYFITDRKQEENPCVVKFIHYLQEQLQLLL